MEEPVPVSFVQVEVVVKANVYFDGKVVSHSLRFADGSTKTLGLVYPGTFHFTTSRAERMHITAGTCRVRVAGDAQFTSYTVGGMFAVPANAGFDIVVDEGIAEYICSFE